MRKLRCMTIDDSDVQRALDHFTKRMETYEIQESDVVSVSILEGKPREVKSSISGETTMCRSFETRIVYWTSN